MNGPAHRKSTRRNSQARTRVLLIEAAAAEFAANGLERTSIERIAKRAEFTRGAFYAHFDGKAAIALALLESRFDSHVERLSRTLATDEGPETRARKAGEDYSRQVAEDPDFQRLLLEFSVYALRDEDFRVELVARLRGVRAQVAELFRRRAAAYGVEAPIPIDRLALMTFASANGVALAKLLEPDQFDDELYGELLGIIFAGFGAIGSRTAAS